MPLAFLSTIDVKDITCQAYRAQLHRGSAADKRLSNPPNGFLDYVIPYCFYPKATEDTRVKRT